MGESSSEKRRLGGLLALDTSRGAERMQITLWRQLSALEKARLVAAATAGARELSLAGIRLRHPSASEDECRLRYALCTLSRSLACQAYPEAEAVAAR